MNKLLVINVLPKFRYPITFLPMNDRKATVNFYFALLNLPIALDQTKCILFEIGQSYWGFCSHMSDSISNPDQVILTLVVDNERNVDEWYEYLIHKDIECLQKPAHNRAFGIYNSFYKDPNGYRLEIQSFDLGKSPI